MKYCCEYKNCGSIETEQYTYPVEVDGEIIKQYLCWEHADKQGFCPMCGYFVAGSGDENWRGGTVCYECYHDIAYETGEMSEYDSEADDYFDY